MAYGQKLWIYYSEENKEVIPYYSYLSIIQLAFPVSPHSCFSPAAAHLAILLLLLPPEGRLNRAEKVTV